MKQCQYDALGQGEDKNKSQKQTQVWYLCLLDLSFILPQNWYCCIQDMVHPSEPYPFHKQGAYMGAPVSKRGVDEWEEEDKRKASEEI